MMLLLGGGLVLVLVAWILMAKCSRDQPAVAPALGWSTPTAPASQPAAGA